MDRVLGGWKIGGVFILLVTYPGLVLLWGGFRFDCLDWDAVDEPPRLDAGPVTGELTEGQSSGSGDRGEESPYREFVDESDSLLSSKSP